MTEEIIKEEFNKAFKKNFPEAIIIDGVNVAGCANLNSLICNCGVICKGRDCYYKQLKRLEQENKELLEARNHFMAENLKYFNALEEIKVISDNYNLTVNKRRKQIADKINEVLTPRMYGNKKCLQN